MLEIVSFSNPRRTSLNGRENIVFDFQGDPHAKTHGRDEEALKRVSGTVWIDAQDREISRMSATLDENYHVGMGLLASVAKGSDLVFDQALIRNEIWLPTAIQVHLNAKALLFVGVHADVDIRFDDYRKFHTDAVPQPGGTIHQDQSELLGSVSVGKRSGGTRVEDACSGLYRFCEATSAPTFALQSGRPLTSRS